MPAITASLMGAPAATIDATDAEAREVSAAIARGDPSALASLYERWFPVALAQTRAMTGRDEAFCLDVVQESAIRIALHSRAMPSRAALEAWLARVVRSATIDELRKERRRLVHERRAGAQTHQDAGTDSPSLVEIDALLASLGEDDRRLVGMRFVRGWSLRRAAAAEGTSIGALHGRVRRALHRLARVSGGGRDDE